MKNIAQVEGQLFHTYSVVSDKAKTTTSRLESLLDGYLELPPHEPQKIGPEYSWSADPLADANWRFQFHSLNWLDDLRVESTLKQSQAGLDLYTKLLKSWIADNPESDPASDYSWFDMAVGLRAIVLLQAVTHFGEEAWLIEAITKHGEHLADSRNYEGKGNHSLHQDMGLVALADFLQRREWIALGKDRITKMFSEAIDDEGVCREGSIDYQYRNYRWYEEALRRLRAAGSELPTTIELALERMPQFMAHATSPSTHYAMLGDTLLHRAPIIEGTPTEWVKDPSKSPQAKVGIFSSGYLFARNSWSTWKADTTASYLTLRFGAGRATAVHGHEDAGSITYDAHGERLLCDSGLFAYEAGDFRRFFRGREAHNVIDVPGRKYYPSSPSPLIAHSVTDDYVMATVLVKGIQGVLWHRTLFYSMSAGYIVVDDRVLNNVESEILQRWQLPVGAVISPAPGGGSLSVKTPERNEIKFSHLGYQCGVRISEGMDNPIAGWRSEEYRQKEASPEVAFCLNGSSVRLTTLIQTRAAGQEDWAVVSGVERTSRDLRFVLTGKQWVHSVTLSSEGVEFQQG